ncbi:hypothetical protein L7F22_022745 [Adiantum nelumboides]|nr:hypothetical protein [Adiantum nelumboides]
MVADLLLSSASSWINGGRAVTMVPTSISSSSVARIAAPLEVALLFGPSLRLGGGAAPVHHMGGGPRTYPGGVTKWQWRRMQLKKSRQIEKARLLREKHIYEARRRSELLAASPALEMPWQKMSRIRPPNFVTADEQVTKLAARFQKRGAEDLWTENDGPESFEVLNEESHFLKTRAFNQDSSQYNTQNGGQSNEQGNRVPDAGPTSFYPSFRTWAKEEARRAFAHSKLLEEVRKRWEYGGVQVHVDKELDEVGCSVLEMTVLLPRNAKQHDPARTRLLCAWSGSACLPPLRPVLCGAAQEPTPDQASLRSPLALQPHERSADQAGAGASEEMPQGWRQLGRRQGWRQMGAQRRQTVWRRLGCRGVDVRGKPSIGP